MKIRKVLCSPNAIGSLDFRYWRAVRVCGDSLNEQAAMKALYLVTRSLEPNGNQVNRMVRQMETRTQRVRHHLRLPPAHDGGALTMKTPLNH